MLAYLPYVDCPKSLAMFGEHVVGLDEMLGSAFNSPLPGVMLGISGYIYIYTYIYTYICMCGSYPGGSGFKHKGVMGTN